MVTMVKAFGFLLILWACLFMVCVAIGNTTEVSTSVRIQDPDVSASTPPLMTTAGLEKVNIATSEEHTKTEAADITASTEDYSTEYSEPTYDYDDGEAFCSTERVRQFRAWFMPTVFSLICFVAVVGNALVILTYVYFGRLKTMTDIYLLNLGVADLLFAVTLPFWAASIIPPWVLGTFLCKSTYTVYRVTFLSGMFLLTCISVDRYFAITKAVSAHRCRSRAIYIGKVSSLVIWALAVLISIPEMAFTEVSTNNTCELYYRQTDQLKMGLQMAQMILGFALPALVMVFCYSSIVKTLTLARSFEKNKAIKVIFAVVSVFLISQIPYNVALIVNTVYIAAGGTESCALERAQYYMMDVTRALAFLRCCLNPFLYAFIGVKFRRDVLKLLKDFGCMSQEHFYRLSTCSGRRFSTAGGVTETETTTSFSP